MDVREKWKDSVPMTGFFTFHPDRQTDRLHSLPWHISAPMVPSTQLPRNPREGGIGLPGNIFLVNIYIFGDSWFVSG